MDVRPTCQPHFVSYLIFFSSLFFCSLSLPARVSRLASDPAREPRRRRCPCSRPFPDRRHGPRARPRSPDCRKRSRSQRASSSDAEPQPKGHVAGHGAVAEGPRRRTRSRSPRPAAGRQYRGIGPNSHTTPRRQPTTPPRRGVEHVRHSVVGVPPWRRTPRSRAPRRGLVVLPLCRGRGERPLVLARRTKDRVLDVLLDVLREDETSVVSSLGRGQGVHRGVPAIAGPVARRRREFGRRAA